MKIWHPAPRGLVNAAATTRWTRKHPAPELVVYLWVWSQRDEGTPPTRRQVAGIFGWTEHHARKMIEVVKQDQTEWLRAYPPTSSSSRRPPHPSKTKHLPPPGDQHSPSKHHGSPDRARVSTQHHTNTTVTESYEEMKEWRALE